MHVAVPSLRTKLLQRLTEPEDLRLYRAALEWDLEDPIIIESEDDLKSEYRWGDKLSPYHHQVTNLITFCRRLPVTLIADDVGLGKTISAGLIASELISRARVSRILIVCPKLLIPQWKEELETKFDIECVPAPGAALLDSEPTGDVGAVITTYHSARIHLEKIPQDRFQMLVLDEAHKLRNLYGVPATPKVATLFQKVLADRLFKYVLMLTATPIHNRLWDIYSLVDLLTAARGHQNPFGGEGMFARNFIADNRTEARQLRPERRDEFRSIVYSYMSRVRRGDVKLDFPERKVLPHRVAPSRGELQLITTITKPIQKLSALAQISILQALTSSPDALRAQLDNMARKGTIPDELASEVRAIVASMTTSAKLDGLALLVDQLQQEQGDQWRMVVFTQRLETQTTIQNFLEMRDIKVGIINGSSGPRNQDTIKRFWKEPPECHVIVSTQAGSEGVNLQAANVLVNYDLPWNPMIVEQRIGRIQRLGSKHKNVCIYNVTLKGTFEEYIVSRLMEKLQLASHAIGDVEALLEASGLDDGDEDGPTAFEEKIRKLVVAALAGKDMQATVELEKESIEKAKQELESQQETINTLLGTNEPKQKGPRSPSLPPLIRSMEAETFARAALERSGAKIEPQGNGEFIVEFGGKRESAKFGGDSRERGHGSIIYAPGTPAFERLVRRTLQTAGHRVEDGDANRGTEPEILARQWVEQFGAKPLRVHAQKIWRFFSGKALTRVRATVAHDSYERLVEVTCSPTEHNAEVGLAGGEPVPDGVLEPASLGVNLASVVEAACRDEGIAEFCRFYNERMIEEVPLTGEDARRRKKIEDDFTPRLECSLVALEGTMLRQYGVEVEYEFDEQRRYSSRLTITPASSSISRAPEFATCAITQVPVPADCLGVCAISGEKVLQHLLTTSDASSRTALPEHSIICSLTGKRILVDESERSSVTGQLVLASQLVTSAVSCVRGEPDYFGRCEFTSGICLKTELIVSEISGKRYRQDESATSAVSGRLGHRQEFATCSQTGQILATAEAEHCDITGSIVVPGVLQRCALTQKRVLPSQLESSGVSGEPVITSLLKTSAVSQTRAEPKYFGICEFTGAEVLQSELVTSAISGTRFRRDQKAQSAVSGMIGHRSEFVSCSQTGQLVIRAEAERCESTGAIVRPGVLDECAVSKRRVLPSELVRCAATGDKALRRYLVTSSVSGAPILEQFVVGSVAGKFCAPDEARPCLWSGAPTHPDDVRTCDISGMPAHAKFVTGRVPITLCPLDDLLHGRCRTQDKRDVWNTVAAKASAALRGARCQIEAAQLSPDGRCLAVSAEVRTMLGIRVQHVGFIYSLADNAIAGSIGVGKRKGNDWLRAA